jgi:UDP-galactopyranose mutase
VICGNVVDIPFAYVVYDHARPQNIAVVREWLTAHDIVLVGRYSEWEYYNSDHAFLAGKRGAEAVRKIQQEGAITKRPATRPAAMRLRDAGANGWAPESSQIPKGLVKGKVR